MPSPQLRTRGGKLVKCIPRANNVPPPLIRWEEVGEEIISRDGLGFVDDPGTELGVRRWVDWFILGAWGWFVV